MARNTRALEISATLPKPSQAQALALYVAEQTVKLTRDAAAETDRDLIADAQKQLNDAQSRSRELASGSPPVESEARRIERDAAREAVYAAAEHLAQMQSMVGMRGERLKIVDPGVEPERPSWPNIPLMLLAAVLGALAVTLLYTAFEFGCHPETSRVQHTVALLAHVKTRDD